MKANNIFSKQNVKWLGIFLIFLAFLTLFFMIMSKRANRRKIVRSTVLNTRPINFDDISDEEENLYETLQIQKVHTAFQESYLELISKMGSPDFGTVTKNGVKTIDLKKEAMLFETYRTAQNNYTKVLRKIEEHEKDYRLRCFARMRKLILAVLYYDKKTGEKMTKFDLDELVKSGALDAAPVCPKNGKYTILYKNNKRFFSCSIHGTLKN